MKAENRPIGYDYAQIPPHAEEAEEAVVAAMMLDSNAYIEHPVQPEWFYGEKTSTVIGVIKDMSMKGQVVDMITVVRALKDRGLIEEIGGVTYITSLARKVISAANIDQHIRIIRDKYTRRQTIRLAYDVLRLAYDESNDVEDVVNAIHKDALGVMDFKQESIVTFGEACNQIVKRMAANDGKHQMTGIATPFTKLNRFTGGWQGSDLVVVAGETSQGKSSLVLNFAMAAARDGVPGSIYSLEMSNLQMASRLLASETGVSSKKIMYEKMHHYDIQTVCDGITRINKYPIYFDDNVNNKIESITSSIRRMVLKYQIKYAVVDYLQNVSDMFGKNEEGSIGSITKILKNLAKELNIVIFAVSQLRRDQNNPLPTLSRLRGSGQIEETADTVIFVYRPEVYGRRFPEPNDEVEPQGMAMIDIAKGRNIGTARMLVRFNAVTTTFYNYEDYEEEEPDENYSF